MNFRNEQNFISHKQFLKNIPHYENQDIRYQVRYKSNPKAEGYTYNTHLWSPCPDEPPAPAEHVSPGPACRGTGKCLEGRLAILRILSENTIIFVIITET